ncbi:hypothetical protein GCM10009551_091230 [Nocardiopsis tropica]
MSMVTNSIRAIAVLTPMSRTAAARAANSCDSCSGRPYSLTSVAPGAEKRSVIWSLMLALCRAARRDIPAIFRPIGREGRMKTGSRTRASRVICQEMLSMTPRVSSSVTTLVTTPARVSEKARCAPSTSLLSRDTSAPVRVRVKKATGIVCT